MWAYESVVLALLNWLASIDFSNFDCVCRYAGRDVRDGSQLRWSKLAEATVALLFRVGLPQCSSSKLSCSI